MNQILLSNRRITQTPMVEGFNLPDIAQMDSRRLRTLAFRWVPAKPTSHSSSILEATDLKRSAFSANMLCKTLNAIYRSVGIDGATIHSGRRSFITALASKGIGVRVLASLAGHKSIATTQAYIDVNDEMKRAAVELVR
ncbi:MAG: tyrosine-type recombinase/integrase [Reyranellales bacterium]